MVIETIWVQGSGFRVQGSKVIAYFTRVHCSKFIGSKVVNPEP
jgi:hypothetical protein